jgi:hypothetical protein
VTRVSFARCASKCPGSSIGDLLKIVLRILQNEDPSKWPPTQRYIYSKNTSTSSLRPHIEKHHLELFKTLAQERGWRVLLPGLVSQARSQASAAPVNNGVASGQPDKFTEQSFHEHLLNFIIADDQVCFLYLTLMLIILVLCIQSLNVVECPEFRALLLLLRNDLKESMIPHRTKLRELIIDAWRRYFQVLKKDLAVTFYYHYMSSCITYIRLHIGSSWQNFIHNGYLVG